MRQQEMDVHRENMDVRWVGFRPLIMPGVVFYKILTISFQLFLRQGCLDKTRLT
jgi:hypothetical protein